MKLVGIGEVWANMLHNVYASLVEKHGFSATAGTDPSGPEGNIVFLHLFFDSLALQPCNPTCEFLSFNACQARVLIVTFQLSPHALPGSKPTRIATVVQTIVCYGQRLPVVDWGSALREITSTISACQ